MHGKQKKFRVIRKLLLLVMVVCLVPVGQAYYLSYKHQKQQEHLKNLLKEGTAQKEGSGSRNEEGLQGKKGIASQDVSQRYKNLQKENKDFIGWLAVEGTEIDYPVLQCEDDEFYLTHNFYKEKDKYGCLYVKSMADVNTPDVNFIIYGHNMRDGAMFGTLDSYGEEAFYRKHKWISFDTLYEERVYEVLSVFQIDIQDRNAFPYYQFYQAEDECEFMEFYRNVKKLSLYGTGVEAEFGDTFLTLSTCSGMGENIRFVVVAKLVYSSGAY